MSEHRLQEATKSWAIYDFADGDQDLVLPSCRIFRVLESFEPPGVQDSEVNLYNSATVAGGGDDRIVIANSSAYTCWVDLGSNGRVFTSGMSIEWVGANFTSGDQVVVVYTLN